MKKNFLNAFRKPRLLIQQVSLLLVLCLVSMGAFAQFPAPYCGVTFSNNVEPITYVSFADVTQTSPAVTGGTDDHEDFTAVVANVNAGQTYTFSLNGNTDGVSFTTYFWVYGDWNQDGDFEDAGEAIAAGSVTGHDGETDDPATYAITDIQIPPSALNGQTRLRIIKKYNASTNPGSCNTTGYGQAEDYTLNVNGLTCTPPTATYSYIFDCPNNQYSVAVNVTSLGSATSLVLTDGTIDYGSPITAPGVYNAGPFAFGTTIDLTLEHNVEILCSTSSTHSFAGCPPVNDDIANATSLTVNADLNCGTTLAGTTQYASQSGGETAPSCSVSGINDDVWYTFVATATAHRVSVSGATNTTALAVYSGTPGALSLISCNSTTGNPGGLTVGETYYIRVYSTSSVATTYSNYTICVGTPPPPPANDEVAGAITLTVNPDLNCNVVTAGTTEWATETTTEVDPSCSASGINDDVWYSFVATASLHQVSVSGTSSTVALAVYSGTPGALVPISCNSTTTYPLGLTVGETYYIRAYTTSSIATTSSAFDICVGTPPPPPANDECANAVALTVNPDLNCGTVTHGTILSATESPDAAACSGTADDDVWYTFTATATSHQISLINITGSTSDMYMEILDGCGGASLQCSDPQTFWANSLTPGNTYVLRVYTWSSTYGHSSEFDVCIGTMPPPPANDEIAGAIALTVNPDYNCGVVTAGTTAGATETLGETAPTCSASGVNDDVWYTFVATAETHRLSVSGASSTAAIAVYSGTPGALTAVSCNSTTGNPAGLTIGETYYVRVYSTSSVATTFSDFELCVGTLPAPPANDEIAGAIALTVNPDYSCGVVTAGTTAGATETVGETAPTCSATGVNDDVWYSFVATAAEHRVTVAGASSTTAVAVYAGTPGALTTVSCNSTTGNPTGLTVGETYYVRVYSTTSTTTTFSNFEICVGTLPPPPSNDDCVNAITISDGVLVTASTVSATESQPGCVGTANDDVWYQFTAGTAGDVTITLTGISSLFDAVLQVFEGTCGSLTSLTCNDDTGNEGVEEYNLTATAGATYYIRVYDFTGTTDLGGDYTLVATGTPLPVTMELLSGQLNSANKAVLNWATHMESGNAGFSVERSDDGKNFSKIAFVPTQAENGNSNSTLRYEYTDPTVVTADAYYRLVQMDVDGRSSLSNVIMLTANNKTAFTVTAYPNPVTDKLNIAIKGQMIGDSQVMITDAVGKVIRTIDVSSNEFTVDMSGLPAGLYMIKYVDDARQEVIKLSKQ